MGKPTMNTELVLEQPQKIGDGGGGFRTVWSPVGTLWAEIQPRGVRDAAMAGRAGGEVTHKIVLRSAPVGSPRRPTPDCRFRSGQRVFAIRGIAPEGIREEYMTCWAQEGMHA